MLKFLANIYHYAMTQNNICIFRMRKNKITFEVSSYSRSLLYVTRIFMYSTNFFLIIHFGKHYTD